MKHQALPKPKFTSTQSRYPKLFDAIRTFYRDATEDYKTWSSKVHMHYGYLRKWTDLFDRERMLDQMVLKAFEDITVNPGSKVVDLGCGIGASLRILKDQFGISGEGVTLSETQFEMAKNFPVEGVNVSLEDYHQLSFADRLFEHAIALESICHSPDKKVVMSEAFRVLKPGGTFAITDCYRKKTTTKMNRLMRWAYDRFRDNWAVPDVERIDFEIQHLQEAGFENVYAEEISWNVAPSLLHSPFLVLKFIAKRLIKGRRIGKESRKNLEAVLLAIIIGSARKRFGYYVIKAQKPQV